jgi:hypothetical protein
MPMTAKCFRVVKNEADVEQFQDDLSNFHDWSRRWRIQFNTKKCNFIRLTHKTSFKDIHYDINGVLLDRVKSVKVSQNGLLDIIL